MWTSCTRSPEAFETNRGNASVGREHPHRIDTPITLFAPVLSLLLAVQSPDPTAADRINAIQAAAVAARGRSDTAEFRRQVDLDYALGLARVNVRTGAVGWLTRPDTVSVHGIDGLVRSGRHELVAVQNGTTPERVLRIRLNDDETAVLDVRVLARSMTRYHPPTHVTVRGGTAFFIGNTGFDALDDSGFVKPGARLSRAVVYRIAP